MKGRGPFKNVPKIVSIVIRGLCTECVQPFSCSGIMNEVFISKHQENVLLKTFLLICIVLLSLCNDNITSMHDRQLF